MRDELYLQQELNAIYLNNKILKLCRHFYRNNIEEQEFTIMKDSKYSNQFRNLSHAHKKKIKESKKICNFQSLVCKTLVEFNQTFKNNNYSAFVFRQNPSMLFLIPECFSGRIKDKKTLDIKVIFEEESSNEEFLKQLLLIGRHHHICQENFERSPFSPFSPFTPVDFSKIHTFDEKINEFDQQEKNQSFLKGYLKKSVIESRKSLQNSLPQQKTSEKITNEKRKSAEGSGKLLHCRTFDFDQKTVEKNIETPSLIDLNHSYDSEDTDYIMSSCFPSEMNEKGPKEKLNFKKKTPKNIHIKNSIKNKRNKECDVIIASTPINRDKTTKIQPRTSLFLMQAKGVYSNINDRIIEKYINVIEKSESINFAHEFFIERSKVEL